MHIHSECSDAGILTHMYIKYSLRISIKSLRCFLFNAYIIIIIELVVTFYYSIIKNCQSFRCEIFKWRQISLFLCFFFFFNFITVLFYNNESIILFKLGKSFLNWWFETPIKNLSNSTVESSRLDLVLHRSFWESKRPLNVTAIAGSTRPTFSRLYEQKEHVRVAAASEGLRWWVQRSRHQNKKVPTFSCAPTYIGNACFCHPLGGHLLRLAVLSLANGKTKSRKKEISFFCDFNWRSQQITSSYYTRYAWMYFFFFARAMLTVINASFSIKSR